MEIDFIAKSLLFDDIEDASSFVKACGFNDINENNKITGNNRVPINDEF
jgi:hypothetical protein